MTWWQRKEIRPTPSEPHLDEVERLELMLARLERRMGEWAKRLRDAMEVKR